MTMESIKCSKACRRCSAVKLQTEYYARETGLNNTCKQCMREAAKKWRIANPEKQNEHNRNYREKQKATAPQRPQG